MKINLYISKSLTELITGCLTGDEMAEVAKEFNYSRAHVVGVVYGHHTCNMDNVKKMVQGLLKAAIAKANKQGKDLERYVRENTICFEERVQEVL